MLAGKEGIPRSMRFANLKGDSDGAEDRDRVRAGSRWHAEQAKAVKEKDFSAESSTTPGEPMWSRAAEALSTQSSIQEEAELSEDSSGDKPAAGLSPGYGPMVSEGEEIGARREPATLPTLDFGMPEKFIELIEDRDRAVHLCLQYRSKLKSTEKSLRTAERHAGSLKRQLQETAASGDTSRKLFDEVMGKLREEEIEKLRRESRARDGGRAAANVTEDARKLRLQLMRARKDLQGLWIERDELAKLSGQAMQGESTCRKRIRKLEANLAGLRDKLGESALSEEKAAEEAARAEARASSAEEAERKLHTAVAGIKIDFEALVDDLRSRDTKIGQLEAENAVLVTKAISAAHRYGTANAIAAAFSHGLQSPLPQAPAIDTPVGTLVRATENPHIAAIAFACSENKAERVGVHRDARGNIGSEQHGSAGGLVASTRKATLGDGKGDGNLSRDGHDLGKHQRISIARDQKSLPARNTTTASVGGTRLTRKQLNPPAAATPGRVASFSYPRCGSRITLALPVDAIQPNEGNGEERELGAVDATASVEKLIRIEGHTSGVELHKLAGAGLQPRREETRKLAGEEGEEEEEEEGGRGEENEEDEEEEEEERVASRPEPPQFRRWSANPPPLALPSDKSPAPRRSSTGTSPPRRRSNSGSVESLVSTPTAVPLRLDNQQPTLSPPKTEVSAEDREYFTLGESNAGVPVEIVEQVGEEKETRGKGIVKADEGTGGQRHVVESSHVEPSASLTRSENNNGPRNDDPNEPRASPRPGTEEIQGDRNKKGASSKSSVPLVLEEDTAASPDPFFFQLVKGVPVLKHAAKGKPKAKMLWVTPDLSELFYTRVGRTSNPKQTSRMPLAELHTARGRGEYPELAHAHVDRCFTLLRNHSAAQSAHEGQGNEPTDIFASTTGGGRGEPVGSTSPGRRRWGIGGTRSPNLTHGRRWRGGAETETKTEGRMGSAGRLLSSSGGSRDATARRRLSEGSAAVNAGERERMGLETATVEECDALVGEIDELVRRAWSSDLGKDFSQRRESFDVGRRSSTGRGSNLGVRIVEGGKDGEREASVVSLNVVGTLARRGSGG